MRWLFATTAVILATALANPGASAEPVYGLPIDILGATFSDGTTLTGEFMLNPNGYIAYGWITTQDGYGLDGTTPIAGITFVSSATSAGLSTSLTSPNFLYASADSYFYSMNLTFEHDLGTPGADPIVLDVAYTHTPQSAECQNYACYGYDGHDGVDTPGNERLIVSGVAMVPEPGAAALLGGPLLGLLAARRRRA